MVIDHGQGGSFGSARVLADYSRRDQRREGNKDPDSYIF
jgi:hypothetical protein